MQSGSNVEDYKLPITKEVLKKYIPEHFCVHSERYFLCDEDRKNDLVMIYKKETKHKKPSIR